MNVTNISDATLTVSYYSLKFMVLTSGNLPTVVGTFLIRIYEVVHMHVLVNIDCVLMETGELKSGCFQLLVDLLQHCMVVCNGTDFGWSSRLEYGSEVE